MSVRMGRFGPFVQIGTKDDADKPRFAGFGPARKWTPSPMPRRWSCSSCRASSGATAEGEEIVANTGRFGPYVKYGAKYVSLKTDDPYTVTLERALEVIREKQIADANRLILDFPEAGIQVLNGRYGPYITDKARNAKIPKDRDPKTLDPGRVPVHAGGGAGAHVRQVGPRRRARPRRPATAKASRRAKAAPLKAATARSRGTGPEARGQGVKGPAEEARAGRATVQRPRRRSTKASKPKPARSGMTVSNGTAPASPAADTAAVPST